MRLLPVPAKLPAVVVALLLASSVPCHLMAQTPANHLYDKFQFGVSGASVILGTTIKIDNANGTAGTEIDFNTIGISKNAFSPTFSVAWRPGRRHQLALSYLYINRTGSKTLTDDVDFGDTSFTAGVKINSKFSAPTLGLEYRFAILAKEKAQVGVQVGLGALFFSLGIDALAGITGGGADTLDVGYSASKSLTGPTGALGLYGAFRAGNHWYFAVNGGAIGAKVSNITASSWVLGADARYFFNNHWGLGGGWGYSGVKVSGDAGADGGWIKLKGSIKYNYNVFRLGVMYALP